MDGRIPQLRLFQYMEKQSSYAARNYGVAQSRGMLLAFTDFDCWLQQDYIDYLDYFAPENLPGGLISGSIEIYYESKNIYEIFDNDIAGINTSVSNLTISEPNGSAAFTLTLSSQPTADVNIDVVNCFSGHLHRLLCNLY